MDEDDEMEIRSHTSPFPPNERIAVTVAASAAVSKPQQQDNNKSLAMVAIPTPTPIQIRKSNGGGGREDCWSEGATAVLIEAWGERYVELSRGNLKQQHWKEVAEIVSRREDYTKPAKTDIQCKNRIDTVKKKYKAEKAKVAAGGGPSNWPFFERLDHLIGPVAKNSAGAADASAIPVGIPVGVASAKLYQAKSSKGNERREEECFADSDESLPPEKKQRRSGVNANGKDKGSWGSSIRMLSQALLKFGEAYEQAESAKIVQAVEMEKNRMRFAKDLELQRMHFFIKSQMQISQHLKHCRGGGANASNHPIHVHSANTNNNNNSSI